MTSWLGAPVLTMSIALETVRAQVTLGWAVSLI